MILRTIKQIAIAVFSFAVITLSSLSLFPSSAVAVPESNLLVMMEQTGVYLAQSEPTEKTTEDQAEQAMDKTKKAPDEDPSDGKKEDKPIVDKIKD